MSRWSPQQYRSSAQGIAPKIVDNAIETANIIHAINADVAPVFTLKHLAQAASVDYGLLRAMVSRSHEEPYKLFKIRKRPSYTGEDRFRVIAIPSPSLMKVQRWITHRILKYVKPHHASVAFSKGDTILGAAKPHCKARWIIKMDVRNFFESINEISVYRVFRSLGFQRLISLELARICTRLGYPTRSRIQPRWLSEYERKTIQVYNIRRMGHLPQGAPTSPMLANLAVRELDELIEKIAANHGMIYSRYADDLTLSTRSESFNRDKCKAVIGEIYAAMGKHGLSPNVTKTNILAPGARKTVLGLLVDSNTPRLPRDFRSLIRQHLYYLSSPVHGPAIHAQNKGFSSIRGMKHHIYGLATYARQIDRLYGDECLSKLNKINWPL